MVLRHLDRVFRVLSLYFRTGLSSLSSKKSIAEYILDSVGARIMFRPGRCTLTSTSFSGLQTGSPKNLNQITEISSTKLFLYLRVCVWQA